MAEMKVIEFRPADPGKPASAWLREKADEVEAMERDWNVRVVLVADTWNPDATGLRVTGYPIDNGLDMAAVLAFAMHSVVVKGPR